MSAPSSLLSISEHFFRHLSPARVIYVLEIDARTCEGSGIAKGTTIQRRLSLKGVWQDICIHLTKGGDEFEEHEHSGYFGSDTGIGRHEEQNSCT
jgi:hypothetical protein